MAIKITETLIKDVKDNIETMMNTATQAEFGSLNDEIPFYPSHEDLEVMDALLWGDDLHFKSKIPKEWCDEVVSKPGLYPERSIKLEVTHRKKDFRFELQLDTKGVTYVAAPKKFPYVHVAMPLKRGKHPKLDGLHDSLTKRADLMIKWFEIKDKVVSVLQAAVSLNQAAKVWPEVIHFLPDSRKEQYKKDIAPKVRAKRDTSELEAAIGGIDRDAMAGELVALRFATA
jgi:hypothetical protein